MICSQQRDADALLSAALAILRNQLQPSNLRSNDLLKSDALCLIRFLTSDSYILPSIDGSQVGSQVEDPIQDFSFNSGSFEPDSHAIPQPAASMPVSNSTNSKYSLNTKRIIVGMVDRNNKEKSIQRMYPWYRRPMLPAFREALENNGTRRDLRQSIDQYTLNQFNNARSRGLGVTGDMLRDYAMQRALEIGAHRYFRASNAWLWRLRQSFSITPRSATKGTSESERIAQMNLGAKISQFYSDYRQNSRFLPQNRIWNMDQSNFNFEYGTKRTLSYKGERVLNNGTTMVLFYVSFLPLFSPLVLSL